MRLKLSGPDYRGKDPKASLADFRKRVEAYEKAYVPLGRYEEDNGIQYIQVSLSAQHFFLVSSVLTDVCR
jgi:6-phosphofructo-2-kinase